ncbi:peptidase S28 [Amylocystis lapponica]|nr:peptidase S28 [Amylocystis lapponica]
MPPIPTPPAVVAPSGLVTGSDGTTLASYDTTYYFDQLIDHNNPSLGTFSQRYWFSYEYYEPGGPIVLFTPGEVAADAENGAAVLLEHRFYGYSNPYGNLSVASLQVHTIQQAIDDLAYFAKTVSLPMPGGSSVKPTQAPWILTGGSYSGALTSFTVVNQPDVFYAAWASSAVVESIVDYWGYFDPIRVFMPQNCSNDVQAVINYIDTTFTFGTPAEINSIKTMFNMNLSHLDDFAGALRNNLWDWQSLQPDSGPDQQFFQFCDALEVKNGVSAPAQGWGLQHALQAWSSYWATTYYPGICGTLDAEDCLGSYDPTQSYYSDISIDNAGRSWEWIVCNYMGFLQDGAPLGYPTIVTRLVQPLYDERQCGYFFPEQFPVPTAPNVAATNLAYHGWFVNVDRLFFANGQRDPWREATVSANGTNFKSTPWQPIAEGDGFHTSDLIIRTARSTRPSRPCRRRGLRL